jgi:hypothetical protein
MGETAMQPGNMIADRRQLVRFIEVFTRGRLTYRGRHYKLAVGADLGNLPDRDRYDLVRSAEAKQILDSLAAESIVDLGLLLAHARDKLISDGQPPFSRPGGLVLLRRTIHPREVSVMSGPPIAHMKALMALGRHNHCGARTSR